jgi:hypothetical protein
MPTGGCEAQRLAAAGAGRTARQPRAGHGSAAAAAAWVLGAAALRCCRLLCWRLGGKQFKGRAA